MGPLKFLKKILAEREAQIKEVKRSLYVIRRSPLTLVSLIVIFIFVLMAILAPYIIPYPEDAISAVHPKDKFKPPSIEHPFGTDDMGRDIFSRVIFGTRISFTVGVIVIALALAIGLPLGLIAGSVGGVLDEAIMRITDMFLSFPPLLLALAIAAALGPSLENEMIAIAIAWWPWYTRLARGQAISIRERLFVEAARAVGVSEPRIVIKHILPNSLTPVIVQASMDFGSVILTSASLSFLGLGAQPPAPEWGLMVNIGRNYFLTSWWVSTFPGFAILIVALAFNLLGDGIGEILNPKARRTMRK